MKNLFNFLLYVIVGCSLFSCFTPEKALENKNYVKAMNMASHKILKGKDIETNTYYLQTASQELVKQTLDNYNTENSTDVNDWKKSLLKFYNVLSKINDNNIKTNGLLTETYDDFCEVKYELDLKIIDYYYDEGIKLLEKSISLNEGQWAREAYYQFQLSEKEGASKYYNLLNLNEECILHGSIFVDAPNKLRLNSVFLKPLSDENQTADCTISVYEGFINFNERDNKSKEKKTKEIKVGQNALTDTSGVTTYEDIMEEVTGYKETTEITYTARQQLDIWVTANTSECFLSNRSINLEVSDQCTEIEYSGDKSVFTSTVDQRCSEFSIKRDLERKLADELSSNLYIR